MNQLCKIVCVSGYVLSQSMVVLSATPEQVESARQLQEQRIESLKSTSPVEVRGEVSHITVNHGILMSPVVTQGDKTDQKYIEKFKYKTEPSGTTYVPYRVLSFLYALKSDKVWIGNAFPFEVGDKVSLRDIEQGIEQFQRVPGQSIKVGLQKDSQDPYGMHIVLAGKKSKPWYGSLGLSNQGNQSTGRYRPRIQLVGANPFHRNDVLSLGYTREEWNTGPFRAYRQWNISYSIPYKKYAFKAKYMTNTTKQPIDSYLGSYEYRSRVRSYGIEVERLLHRNQSEVYKLIGSIEKYHKHNYIESIELPVQHIDSTDLGIGASYHKKMRKGELDLTVFGHRNTRWMRGGKDTYSTPHGVRWNVDVAMNQYFQVKSKYLVEYRALIHSQWASHDVYSKDEISIGGLYTVRGFSNDYSKSAKSGWYVQQDLIWHHKDISPFIGLDIGAVYRGRGNTDEGHTLAGFALGVKGRAKKMSYTMSLSTPLLRPHSWHGNRLVGYGEVSITI